MFWTDPGLGQWAHQLPHGHRQYQSFFDLVGVTESPSPSQTEGVLRGSADQLATTFWTTQIELWCTAAGSSWTSTSPTRTPGLDTDSRPHTFGRDPLSTECARHAGEAGDAALRRWAPARKKIELISNNLIRRDRTTQRALAAAGTRPAEDVIDTFVDPDTLRSG